MLDDECNTFHGLISRSHTKSFQMCAASWCSSALRNGLAYCLLDIALYPISIHNLNDPGTVLWTVLTNISSINKSSRRQRCFPDTSVYYDTLTFPALGHMANCRLPGFQPPRDTWHHLSQHFLLTPYTLPLRFRCWFPFRSALALRRSQSELVLIDDTSIQNHFAGHAK